MLGSLDDMKSDCHACVAMATEATSTAERPLAAYYDRLASVYGEGEYAAARRGAVLATIAGELQASRAVLDLGCGNGAFLPVLADDRRVVGMDLSIEMLHAARRRGLAAVDLVRGDACALPLAAGAFDLVLMSHVLLLIPDLDECVAGIARVLQPGGVLIATVGATGGRDVFRQLLGGEGVRELETALASVSAEGHRDDPTAVVSACRRGGLEPSWRRAEFAVSWPALEEWVRLRWLSIADEALRLRIDRLLTGVRSRATGGSVPAAETLLVARKDSGESV